MFVVPAVLVYFFTIIFAKFLEPEYAVKMKEIMTNTATSMYEKMGMDQEKIDEALAESEKAFENQFNPGFSGILMSLGMVIVMYFIGALIFAAIFKKDPPLFAAPSEE